jgi:hypothetical protein
MPSSATTRFITSIGHGEPAITPGAQAGEVEAGQPRLGELGDEHGRHAVQHRAPLPLDGRQRRAGLDAAGQQPAGELVDVVVEAPVRPAAPARDVDQRLPVAEAVRGRAQPGADRVAEQRLGGGSMGVRELGHAAQRAPGAQAWTLSGP